MAPPAGQIIMSHKRSNCEWAGRTNGAESYVRRGESLETMCLCWAHTRKFRALDYRACVEVSRTRQKWPH